MNAPLRRVAISVLVLFTLLIVNVNYIQVVRSDELRENPSNTRVLAEEYDRERGSIVVDGQPGRRVGAHRRPAASTCGPVPAGAAVRGRHRLLLADLRPDRHRAAPRTTCWPAPTPRLFVRRIADLFTGRDPAGGDVVLTLDPAVQQAAMAGLEGVTGAVVALDPATGAVLGMASTPDLRPEPAVQPRPGRDPRLRGPARAPRAPTRGSTRRSARTTRPARSSRSSCRPPPWRTGYTPQTVDPRAGRAHRCPTAAESRELQRQQLQPRRRAAADRRADGLLQHRLRPARASSSARTSVREMAEAFGMDGESFDDPAAGQPTASVGDIEDDAALGADVDRPARRAHDPAAGRHDRRRGRQRRQLMAPYLVDQVRAPDLSVLDRDRSRGVPPSRSPRTSPAS